MITKCSPLLQSFHMNPDMFLFSGAENDHLESCVFLRNIQKNWINLGEFLKRSNWHQSKLFSCSQIVTFLKKKIYFLWMHGDWPTKKTMRITTAAGRTSRAFCHTMKWSNVKIYYSYYYKYIYKKRNHFYLWILQGEIDLVNKVLSHVCTYLVLIRKWSLCWYFSVSHSLMVQYEKKAMKSLWNYCSILYCTKDCVCCEYPTGRDTLCYVFRCIYCCSVPAVDGVS